MEVSDEALKERMAALGIYEEDLVEKFVRGWGPGGQKVNKTASCVFLRHPPTNLQVKCQDGRSRSHNRIRAREELCAILEDQRAANTQAKRAAAARRRRAKRGRPRAIKAAILKNKRHRAGVKKMRRRPSAQD